MKRIVLSVFFVFAFASFLHTQEVCKRTTLFFESGKYTLTKKSIDKLDSLIDLFDEGKYLVELYGHADTVGNAVSNKALADQRIKSVHNYFSRKATCSIRFNEKNLLETNYSIKGTHEDVLAFNRCVDVFFLPIENDRIVMNGNRGESISVSPDYFEPCGVCNSQPQIRSYLSGEEAAADNITLQTTTGDSLITGGMLGLDCKPCAEKKTFKADTSICLTVTMKTRPPCKMTVWKPVVRDGKTYWEQQYDSVIFDAAGLKITSCTYIPFINYDCMKGGKGYRDEKADADTVFSINLPETADFVRCSLYDKKTNVLTRTEKTIPLDEDKINTPLRAVARKGDDYYFLSGTFNKLHPELKKTNEIPPPRTKVMYIHPALSDFEKLQYSDTSLRIKSGEQKSAGTFGFFIPGYNEFIPIGSIADKNYYARIPAMEFQYAFLKRNKVYTLPREALKEKYSRRKNRIRVKIHRKQKQKFKKAREFFMTGTAGN